ncbi:hypothetical protein MANES_08G047351v8 [Manihot esculenta]|uniref:Uncharacterized protein n=1 Tax=Manihot esculenta TaxID=3983 RepID=A0ACB7H821_MANES|nr:hypothetical protein MANES_08G047351v8 [Manihot esculenta]
MFLIYLAFLFIFYYFAAVTLLICRGYLVLADCKNISFSLLVVHQVSLQFLLFVFVFYLMVLILLFISLAWRSVGRESICWLEFHLRLCSNKSFNISIYLMHATTYSLHRSYSLH